MAMKRYDKNVDYCGPDNGWLTRLISNKPWGASINWCCYRHDQAYEKGGSYKDRAKVDEEFRQCVYERLVAKWWIPKFMARVVANQHWLAVRGFGSGLFKYRA